MTAPDPTWRDRALKASPEEILRLWDTEPFDSTIWSTLTVEALRKVLVERDALAKRCAEYQQLMGEADVYRVGLRAKLDVAELKLSASLAYIATLEQRYMHFPERERCAWIASLDRAALAKIAEKEGG